MENLLMLIFGLICCTIGFLVNLKLHLDEKKYMKEFQMYLNAQLNVERALRKKAYKDVSKWKQKYYTEILTNLS